MCKAVCLRIKCIFLDLQLLFRRVIFLWHNKKQNPTWDWTEDKCWWLCDTWLATFLQSCAVCQGEREVETANVAYQQYDKDFTCTF